MMNRFRRTSNPSTKSRTIFRRNKLSSNNNESHHHPLAQFDACIEACDALAASSSRQTSALVADHQEEQDEVVERISDCSVLVSPDGALLLTCDNMSSERYSWTQSTSHHPTIGHDEEYISAVLTGNDLTPLGDYDSNGFSGVGWDVDAASNTLTATHSILKCLESFVEGVALCQKQKGAALVGCCGKWSNRLEKVRLQHASKFEMGGSRVGPLLAEQSSLTNALMEMEKYYSSCAESSSQLWRDACCHENHRIDASDQFDDTNDDGMIDNKLKEKFNKAIDNSLIQGIVPKIKLAVKKSEKRNNEREMAIIDIRSRVAKAQDNLTKQKDWSYTLWQRVKNENKKIDQIVNQQVQEQNLLMKRLRDEKNATRLEQSTTEGTMSDRDLWEMIKDVESMEEFQQTDLFPRSRHKVPPHNDVTISEQNNVSQTTTNLDSEELIYVPNISRSVIEKESDIDELRRAALEADDLIEDAAGALLNVMSKLDTTTRSARVAAETSILSECNAAHQCLRSIVEIERAALREQISRLQKLEMAVDAINVRNDIDNYICRDKAFPGGSSHGKDNDDGGVAAALAVLNSHGDDCFDASRTNVTRPNFSKFWADTVAEADDDDEKMDIEFDFFKTVIKMLFEKSSEIERSVEKSKRKNLKKALSELNSTLSENSQQGVSARQAVLYELNNQRSVNTVIQDEQNFECLCNLFDSFLNGCGRESIDVSNAKILMILSQTFYFAGNEDGNQFDRASRVFIKNRISSHEIWTDDYFWDQALYQCVAESLKKSGVLLNYIKLKGDDSTNGAHKRIKWHDLSPKEYASAAAQVHSVVFAQIGTLSHSMLELGCSVSRACAFVRRLSIRYQLPLSLRITLIHHLTGRKHGVKNE